MNISHATRRPSVLRLVLSVVIATCVFTIAANAHPSFVGRFTLPYEVHWGKAVLPAGQYLLQMNATTAPALITPLAGGRMIFTELPTIADSKSSGTYLTVTSNGSERRVRSVNVSGKVVMFAPLTKVEQETLAKSGQINRVQVISAKK